MSAGIRTGLSRVLSTHFELLHVLSRYLDETGAAIVASVECGVLESPMYARRRLRTWIGYA